MSTTTLIQVLVWWAAIFSTSFVVLYPLLSPGWRRTWIGWGLLVSSTALALLLDLSLASQIFGVIFSERVWLIVTALVAAGTTLKVTALLVTKTQVVLEQRRERNPS